MVLYNSPYAVAALLLGLIIASLGVLVVCTRLGRLLRHAAPDTPRGIVRREVRNVSLAILAIVSFWFFLLNTSYDRAFHSHSTAFVPTSRVEWRPPTSPPLSAAYDRFELPSSASRAEHARRR